MTWRRLAPSLWRQYLIIARNTGYLALGTGAALLFPLLWTIGDPGIGPAAFVVPALGAAALGGALMLAGRSVRGAQITLREGAVVVVAGWAVAVVFSALPFALSGRLSLLHGVFEAVSGWTTTGLSMVADVESFPRSLLLWRSFMQYLGGAGLAVIMISAIVGPAGLGLYTAEARTDQLLPQIRRTVSLILRIYVAYAVVGTVLYRLAGMGWFDALNHTFTALSTGGFSTKNRQFGFWNSVPLEGVTILLMVLGAISFQAHHLLVTGRVKGFFRDPEVPLMLALLAPATAIIWWWGGETVRHGVFHAVSALTTTGFSAMDISKWSDLGLTVLVILMLIGGAAGSTAGGIKLVRVYILWRSLKSAVLAVIRPARQVQEEYTWRGESRVYLRLEHFREAGTYAALYLAAYFAGLLIFLAQGFPLRDSMFDMASALGNVGLSTGITGPQSPPVIVVTEIVAMLLGRLEFLAVGYALLKAARDLKALGGGFFGWLGSRVGGAGR